MTIVSNQKKLSARAQVTPTGPRTMLKRVEQAPRSTDRKLLKYYVQRYQLFSRFDDGIELDDEAWWSVTPEKIARHIATRFHQSLGDGHITIVDGFCGVGGNLIQFALHAPHTRVIGCDNNLKRLRMARNNAKIYGVEHQCEFILGDFMSMIRSFQSRNVDAIFLSPPWGGVDYTKVNKYSLDNMTPDGYEIVRLCRKYLTNNIAFLMPRNTDIDEVRRVMLTKRYPELEFEQNMVGTKIKTLTMYLGNLIDQEVEAIKTIPTQLSLTALTNGVDREEDRMDVEADDGSI